MNHQEITGVAGVIIWTERFDVMLKFYVEALGLKSRSVKTGFANFEWGDFRLSIGHHSGVRGSNRDPHRLMINLAVMDIEKTHRRLESLGVRFVRQPEHERWGGWVATFLDPDGNTLQLMQMQPAARQAN